MARFEHITIRIETGNAAFEDSPTGEIARLLRDLADRFEQDGIPPSTLHDLNGNFCGEVQIVGDEDDEGQDREGYTDEQDRDSYGALRTAAPATREETLPEYRQRLLEAFVYGDLTSDDFNIQSHPGLISA